MISVTEAARRAGIVRQSARAAIKAGTLKASPIYGASGKVLRWLIAEDDCDAWIERLAQRERPGPKPAGTSRRSKSE